MDNNQPSDFLDLEREMHERFTPWVDSHHKSNPKITDLGYEPSRYESQKITVAKEENHQFPIEAENEHVLRWLNGSMAHALGSATVATAFTDGFKRDTDQGPLHTQILDKLRNGQNIALITPHIELNDVPLALAGVALAVGNKDYFKYYGAIVNKLMSRQAMESTPVSDQVRAFGSIYWVIPDTESTKKWGIRDEIIGAVNMPVFRILRDERKVGGKLVAIAPTGTRIIQTEHGALQLPEISKGSFNLLSKFDALLPVSIDASTGKFAVGTLVKVSHLTGEASNREVKRLQFANKVTRLLGAYAQLATGKEVELTLTYSGGGSIEQTDAETIVKELV